MIIQSRYEDLVTPELLEGAIEHYSEGYVKDYHLLHCMMKKYAPKLVMEIGTHIGTGTKIIKNAVGPEAEVFSLDLPLEIAGQSAMHPVSEGRNQAVGSACDLPFTQLLGDSMFYNFGEAVGKRKIQGWWIDGDHDYGHVQFETSIAAAMRSKLIMWHDTDAPQVWEGLIDGIRYTCGEAMKPYKIFQVTGTRVSFAVLNP